ncbi:MAG TPA: sensor histidine kinase [Candidatus Limnocylindrales bacterium]|jgi:two-component system sensor histidine kinase DegS|nr:sensor histidine kinase [Candidatus Limnocylindrales bacterium]
MDAARTAAELGDARAPREEHHAPEPRDLRDELPDELREDYREVADARFDGLHEEAAAAIGYAANTLRSVRERYRHSYTDELGTWQALRDELDELERRSPDLRPRLVEDDRDDPTSADAAEAGAEEARMRALRSEVNRLGGELGGHQTELAKLEVAMRNLESTWLFLKRGDTSLVASSENLPTDMQMRIVEAQEGERSRLAQEIHDGPAQVLSNAIFQVEYIERVIDHDDRLARTELRFLRELLRRELGSVRTFISQLRPPVLDELGLDGAIADAVARTTALTGLAITTDLAAPSDRLSETQQTVVLRVVQEALQNVRKHGGASSVTVASVIDGSDWVMTVRDDGRGFDVGAVAARGRRNFGLQFMQERAELIGARFEVHSRPDGGTIVRLAIPMGEEETAQ